MRTTMYDSLLLYQESRCGICARQKHSQEAFTLSQDRENRFSLGLLCRLCHSRLKVWSGKHERRHQGVLCRLSDDWKARADVWLGAWNNIPNYPGPRRPLSQMPELDMVSMPTPHQPFTT